MIKKIKKKRPKNYIAENLRGFRKSFGFSLDNIAYSTNLSKAYLSQIENKDYKSPSIDTAYLLYQGISETAFTKYPYLRLSFELFCFSKINFNPKELETKEGE